MNAPLLTPNEAVSIASDFNMIKNEQVERFLRELPARNIELFLQRFAMADNNVWFPRAKVALDIRLAEDAALTADKLVKQTDRLVKETITLRGLTFVLGILAVIQIFVAVMDLYKHK